MYHDLELGVAAWLNVKIIQRATAIFRFDVRDGTERCLMGALVRAGYQRRMDPWLASRASRSAFAINGFLC